MFTVVVVNIKMSILPKASVFNVMPLEIPAGYLWSNCQILKFHMKMRRTQKSKNNFEKNKGDLYNLIASLIIKLQ